MSTLDERKKLILSESCRWKKLMASDSQPIYLYVHGFNVGDEVHLFTGEDNLPRKARISAIQAVDTLATNRFEGDFEIKLDLEHDLEQTKIDSGARLESTDQDSRLRLPIVSPIISIKADNPQALTVAGNPALSENPASGVKAPKQFYFACIVQGFVPGDFVSLFVGRRRLDELWKVDASELDEERVYVPDGYLVCSGEHHVNIEGTRECLMTISLLSLDDRLYDDLVKEFQALIPRYAPDDWTDRNPSDPGIMLVEFLAWLTESQIYRINRVPKDVYLAHFKWLIGDQWKSSSREFEEPLKDARRQALEIFSHPHRLISKEDFERVIIDRFGVRDLDPRSSTTCTDTYHASVCSCVERVYCVPERDLSASDPQQEQRGHVSVMLVTRPVTTPVATQELSVGPEYKYQVNPCGNRLVAYGGNQLWTWTAAAPSAPIERLQLPVDAEVTHCAISPDDNAVAVSCNQGAVRGWVWKADGSGQFPLVESGTNMVNKGILSLSLACQNGPLAIQFVDKSVQLCQLWWYAVKEKKWQPLQGRVLEGKAYLRTDGFRMAIQTETSLQLWQLEDNWLAATPDMEIQGRKIVVSESPSHRFAAVISDANELALWDIWRCEKLWTRPYTGTTPDPKFTCDGKRLIVPTNVGDRECWAVATGETLPLEPRFAAEILSGKR